MPLSRRQPRAPSHNSRAGNPEGHELPDHRPGTLQGLLSVQEHSLRGLRGWGEAVHGEFWKDAKRRFKFTFSLV